MLGPFFPIPVPDPLFLSGLRDRVAVYRDLGADGADRTAHAGPKPDYQPVAGLDALACYAEPVQDRNREPDRKQGHTVQWLFLFGDARAEAFDRTYKFVLTTARGDTHTVLVTGKSKDETGVGHHWVVEGVEYLG